MKIIMLTFSVFFLVSCNDTLRTRIGKCRGADNIQIECSSTTDALSADKIRKKYIAEVTVTLEVGQKQIIFKEYAQDSDFDQDLTCSLEVTENKQFNYSFQNGKLVLSDGVISMTLTRTNGAYNDGILGSWSMKETLDQVETITDLTFKDTEEVRIRKVCNLN